jgi:hypothetical protein
LPLVVEIRLSSKQEDIVNVAVRSNGSIKRRNNVNTKFHMDVTNILCFVQKLKYAFYSVIFYLSDLPSQTQKEKVAELMAKKQVFHRNGRLACVFGSKKSL